MTLQKPPKSDLWIHVERLDAEDGKVWAVQSWVKGEHVYQTARAVVLQAHGFTNFFGPKAKQPKAVIVVPGGLQRLVGGVVYVTQG